MDSIEYADPETINGLNLYAYCGNNPVMNEDPEGHFLHILFASAVGLIAGVVGQVISDALSGEWSSWQTYVGAAVGGAVAGALVTIGGPVAASVAGSLATDATTLGLNLLTGQETRTSQEILFEIVENAALSAAFAYSGEIVSKVSSNVGPQMLKPLIKETSKISLSVFLKEMSSESFNAAIESFWDYLYFKAKNLLSW